MISLDYARTLELLNECVQERGADFTYESPEVATGGCFYAHPIEGGNPEPACIVGLVMSKLGISSKWLQKNNTCGSSSALVELAIEDGLIESITVKAKMLLYRTQYDQDRDISWGEAVNSAIERIEMDAYSD